MNNDQQPPTPPPTLPEVRAEGVHDWGSHGLPCRVCGMTLTQFFKRGMEGTARGCDTPPAPVPASGGLPLRALIVHWRIMAADMPLMRCEPVLECANQLEKLIDGLAPQPPSGGALFTDEDMAEAVRVLAAPVPEDSWPVHVGHCCKDHGCKYGYEKCPVVLGLANQEHPCEDCQPPSAGAGDGPTPWHEQYMAELQRAEDLAEKYKDEGDMYGCNFHQGRASGLIGIDIIAGQILVKLEQTLAAREQEIEGLRAEVQRLTIKLSDSHHE